MKSSKLKQQRFNKKKSLPQLLLAAISFYLPHAAAV
jgi:hypothetical protein